MRYLIISAIPPMTPPTTGPKRSAVNSFAINENPILRYGVTVMEKYPRIIPTAISIAVTTTVFKCLNSCQESTNCCFICFIKNTSFAVVQKPRIEGIHISFLCAAAGCEICTASYFCSSSSRQLPVRLALNAHISTLLFLYLFSLQFYHIHFPDAILSLFSFSRILILILTLKNFYIKLLKRISYFSDHCLPSNITKYIFTGNAIL